MLFAGLQRCQWLGPPLWRDVVPVTVDALVQSPGVEVSVELLLAPVFEREFGRLFRLDRPPLLDEHDRLRLGVDCSIVDDPLGVVI